MAAQAPQTTPDPVRERTPSAASPETPSTRPWRTEGLPKAQPPDPRRRWVKAAIWFVGYLLVFGLFTLQDRFSGPQLVPYTEFKNQVATKNVAELFARGDSIEGQLQNAVPLPGQ